MKDTIGPRVMNADQAAQFTRAFYDAYQAAPMAAPLDLAQNLVHGAVEYARTLGFDPAPDFDATRDHLGPWSVQGAITFGRDGKPFFIFIQGPRVHSRPTRQLRPHRQQTSTLRRPGQLRIPDRGVVVPY